jgi:hypothetical protein
LREHFVKHYKIVNDEEGKLNNILLYGLVFVPTLSFCAVKIK